MTPVLLACALLGSSIPRIAISHGSEGDSLLIGKASLPLYHRAWFPYGGGRVINSTAEGEDFLAWQTQGSKTEKIDFWTLMADWLKDDTKWGGSDAANKMRYMAGPGGGLSFQLEELIPTSGSDAPGLVVTHIFEPKAGINGLLQVRLTPTPPSPATASLRERETSRSGLNLNSTLGHLRDVGNDKALGLLDIHLMGTPTEPVASQMLVRFSLHPFRLDFLRAIPNHADILANADRPRLFQVGARLYCIEGNHIEELDRAGGAIHTLSSWDPSEVPYGLAGGRWIVGAVEKDGLYEIVATDLLRQKSFLLVKQKSDPSENFTPLSFDPGSISGDSDFVLLHWIAMPTGKLYSLTIHLPDGHRQAAPAQATDVVGSYVIAQGTRTVDVYRAATGKRVFSSRYSRS